MKLNMFQQTYLILTTDTNTTFTKGFYNIKIILVDMLCYMNILCYFVY